MPKAILDTCEFTIVFHIHPSKFANRVIISVVMDSKSIHCPYGFKSKADTVEKVYINDLCDYLNSHSERIRTKGHADSTPYPYVDYDYLYKVHAFAGRYDGDKDDSFYSMSLMLHTGFTDKRRNVFMGGEFSVTGKQILQFTKDLKQAVQDADSLVYQR